MNVHIQVVLGALISVVGDFFGKKWAIGKNWVYYVLALVMWTIGSVVYLPVLAKQGLVVSTILWCLISVIGFTFLGVVVFKETLTPLQWTGVVLGATGMVLLST